MAAPGQVAMMAVTPLMGPENSMRWACALQGPMSKLAPTGVLATRRAACWLTVSGDGVGSSLHPDSPSRLMDRRIVVAKRFMSSFLIASKEGSIIAEKPKV